MSDKDVCRTAPAKPGLLITQNGGLTNRQNLNMRKFWLKKYKYVSDY